MLHPWGFTHLPFSSLYGFNTLKLAHMLDSLVRVSRRVECDHFIKCVAVKPNRSWRTGRQESTRRHRLTLLYVQHPTKKLHHWHTSINPLCGARSETTRGWLKYDLIAPQLSCYEVFGESHSLTTYQFQRLFTLFSKFFSSFHHCTCSLSVSEQYLALAERHLPISSAFPNWATLASIYSSALVRSLYGSVTLCSVLFHGT